MGPGLDDFAWDVIRHAKRHFIMDLMETFYASCSIIALKIYENSGFEMEPCPVFIFFGFQGSEDFLNVKAPWDVGARTSSQQPEQFGLGCLVGIPVTQLGHASLDEFIPPHGGFHKWGYPKIDGLQ